MLALRGILGVSTKVYFAKLQFKNTLAHLQVTSQSHDIVPYVWIDAP